MVRARSGWTWFGLVVASALVLLATLRFGAPQAPAAVCYVRRLDAALPIRLDFGETGVKVVGWDREYIKVEVRGIPLTRPLDIESKENLVTCRTKVRVWPSWEPGYRVMLPARRAVGIMAKDVWLQGCTVGWTDAETADLKDCTLVDGFVADGDHLSVRHCDTDGSGLFRRRGTGQVTYVTVAARRDLSCYR